MTAVAPEPPPESPAGEARDPQFATTLARGLAILRCFTPDDPMLGNSQIATRTGLSRPTVARFTYTLVQLHYLRTDPATGKYLLGPAVLSLGYPMLSRIALRQIARPGMADLALYVHGAVSMGVRDRLDVVYVETSRSRQVLSSQLSDIGMIHPLIASAMGHAYIAACASKARESLINTIQVMQPTQWGCFHTLLEDNIRHYQRTGFCVSHGEFLAGFDSVAVPLKMNSAGDIYMFNCVMPSTEFTAKQLVEHVGPRLVGFVRSLQAH